MKKCSMFAAICSGVSKESGKYENRMFFQSTILGAVIHSKIHDKGKVIV